MKKYVMIVLLVLVGMITMAQSKEEQKVGEVVQKMRKAMVDADSVTLYKLTSPDLSYGHSSGHIDTQKSFVGDIASGKSDFVTIDLSDQTIEIVGKIAIVRHTLIGATLDSGKTSTVKLHVMLIWQKGRKGWILLARQATKLT